MDSITLDIIKQVTESITIEFPCYRKHEAGYFLMVEPAPHRNSCPFKITSVDTLEDNEVIMVEFAGEIELKNELSKSIPASEDQFLTAISEINRRIYKSAGKEFQAA